MRRFRCARYRSLPLLAAIVLAGCAEVTPPRQEPAGQAPPPPSTPRADVPARAGAAPWK